MIPDKTIGRLSVYRRILNRLLSEDVKNVFSHQLAVMAGVTPSQVRRDIMSIGYSGNPNRGYGVIELIESIGHSLDDPEGQHVALVGHSGAGKTTIVALLTRLIDPTSGQILVGDIDIRKFKQEDYREFLGTVLQEHSLYSETIAQNIAYGKSDATRKEIIAAAKSAQAHSFIKKLPGPRCVIYY